MSAHAECEICGAPTFAGRTEAYRRCSVCGHERRAVAVDAPEMNNDRLELTAIRRRTALDRFQAHVVAACARSDGLLLDVGSGSGRFLYHQRAHFRQLLGIEVSATSRRFAREQLGLRIETDLPRSLPDLSLVTFWHSLEHIPTAAAHALLEHIRAAAAPTTRVLVCVPNADSLQYRVFGENYAYYDLSQHLHQFTPDSLDRLLRMHGFIPERRFHAFAYAAFGYLQGLLNFGSSRHNYLYYRAKRGERFGLPVGQRAALDVWNYTLGAALLPLAAALTLYDRARFERAGVLTTCYRLEH